MKGAALVVTHSTVQTMFQLSLDGFELKVYYRSYFSYDKDPK